jgi:hypothetical protein
VNGSHPGTFIIDNSCFRMIVQCEGNHWIGRPVEYQDSHMRFLDTPEALEEAMSEFVPATSSIVH